MELKPNMYVRTKSGIIAKIICTRINHLGKETIYVLDKEINIDELEMGDLYITINPLSNDMTNIIDTHFGDDKILAKEPSYNIIDLIEYMDLLVIENKLKDIDNREIYLFNPVRCDGFTTFEDGKHCMIINMDYIIPIENIKVYQVLTHEQFNNESYKMGQ